MLHSHLCATVRRDGSVASSPWGSPAFPPGSQCWVLLQTPSCCRLPTVPGLSSSTVLGALPWRQRHMESGSEEWDHEPRGTYMLNRDVPTC